MHMHFSLKAKEAFKRARQYNSDVINSLSGKTGYTNYVWEMGKTNLCVLSAEYAGGFRL